MISSKSTDIKDHISYTDFKRSFEHERGPVRKFTIDGM